MVLRNKTLDIKIENMTFNKLLYMLLGFALLCNSACDPYEDEDLADLDLPAAPQMQVSPVEGDGNRFIVSFVDNNYFDWLWDCPGGTPPVMKAASDTIVYPRAGEYTISLHVSASGGNGSATSSTNVTVAEDLPQLCDGEVALLTGGCTQQCWTLSPAAGAVQVGSAPLTSDYFVSTGNDPTQGNDKFCFNFTNEGYLFDDGGETFSACSGYVAIAGYEHPPNATYFLNPQSGEAQEGTVVELSEGSWLAVEDSGPNYEIISITEAELVLSSPINPCPGGGPGYFTLTLIPTN